MDRVAGYGYNVVQSYQFATITDDGIADYMNAAQARGLKVLFHLGVKTLDTAKVDRVHRQVLRFKDHAALYGWYLSDEPSTAQITPDNLKAIYQWIKSTDVNRHPVFTSNWEFWNFYESCDVDLPQMYNGPPSALKLGK